jgi:hypothetical protein
VSTSLAARARPWVLAACAVVGVLVGRSMLEGRAALRRASEADAQGDVEAALAFSMRAAKWYVPFADHPRAAYDKLREIARRAEAAGDPDTALVAWQAIRGAAYATRGPYLPFAERVREADGQIALLLASKPPPGVDRNKPRERLIEEHRARLSAEIGAQPLAVAFMYAGLALALFASYRLFAALEASLGDGTERDSARRRAFAALGIAALGFGMFVIALSRA